jgi:type II secretory pathway pseudopilin PulG
MLSMRQERQAGFAMFDVLVAVLLLAIALTGACLSLVHTMRASHAALLATRAVDLATDLSEQLRHAGSAAQAASLLAASRMHIAAVLPVAGMDPADIAQLQPLAQADLPAPGAAGGLQLVLRWRQAGAASPRELRLPLASFPAEGP